MNSRDDRPDFHHQHLHTRLSASWQRYPYHATTAPQLADGASQLASGTVKRLRTFLSPPA
ncbi:MAG: hypothetical protein ACR2HZ_03455 [Gemmatimonadaceae bacterium]